MKSTTMKYLCQGLLMISESVALYDCFLLGLTWDDMTGVACEADDAHFSGAPDFTLQWRVHVVPFLFADFANVRTGVLLVNDFGFGCFDIWTAFSVDECILG